MKNYVLPTWFQKIVCAHTNHLIGKWLKQSRFLYFGFLNRVVNIVWTLLNRWSRPLITIKLEFRCLEFKVGLVNLSSKCDANGFENQILKLAPKCWIWLFIESMFYKIITKNNSLRSFKLFSRKRLSCTRWNDFPICPNNLIHTWLAAKTLFVFWLQSALLASFLLSSRTIKYSENRSQSLHRMCRTLSLSVRDCQEGATYSSACLSSCLSACLSGHIFHSWVLWNWARLPIWLLKFFVSNI